jgi:hypothetical protein
MKWAHLPNEGGIYNQDPQFIDDIDIIFNIKNAYEASQAKEQEKKMERQSRRGKMRR